MIPVLLILIPLACGFAGFFIPHPHAAKNWSLVSSMITLVISIGGLTAYNGNVYTHFQAEWLTTLGARFSVGLDGMGQILTLLTAVSFPVIFISTYRNEYKNAKNFYALMLLSQAGLMGVFVATDALLFYFFWELALIPVYFLSSQWGGEKRIQATFKFFIYTFTGSLLMLVGIIYLYTQTPNHSFSLDSFYSLHSKITGATQ